MRQFDNDTNDHIRNPFDKENDRIAMIGMDEHPKPFLQDFMKGFLENIFSFAAKSLKSIQISH